MRPVKTYDFIIVLKQPSASRFIDWMSKLMLFTAIVAFMYQASINIAQKQPAENQSLYFIFSFLIIAWWLYSYLREQKGLQPFYRFALMIAAWGWYIHPHGRILVVIYLIAAILEKPVKVQPEYAFDEDLIVFNSFPQKKYGWDDVNNVVLKDGLLTIDLKNNRLIQKEVNDEVTPKDEKDFNDFCQSRLEGKTKHG
jgi:hypothetical protein